MAKMTEAQKLVNKITRFLKTRNLHEGLRIYFDNKAVDLNYDNEEQTVIEDIQPQDYIEYVDEEYVVVLVFDGCSLYEVLNTSSYLKFQNDFINLLDRNGYKMYFGDSWNASIVKEEK